MHEEETLPQNYRLMTLHTSFQKAADVFPFFVLRVASSTKNSANGWRVLEVEKATKILSIFQSIVVKCSSLVPSHSYYVGQYMYILDRTIELSQLVIILCRREPVRSNEKMRKPQKLRKNLSSLALELLPASSRI